MLAVIPKKKAVRLFTSEKRNCKLKRFKCNKQKKNSNLEKNIKKSKQ